MTIGFVIAIMAVAFQTPVCKTNVKRSIPTCMQESRASNGSLPIVIEEIHEPARRVVFLDRYFKTYVPPHQKIDFVMIIGIPAAAIVYDRQATQTVAENIYLNNELVEQLDVGPQLREVIFEKHKHTNFEHVDMKPLASIDIADQRLEDHS